MNRYILRPDGSYECHDCGSVVHDMAQHDAWHEQMTPTPGRPFSWPPNLDKVSQRHQDAQDAEQQPDMPMKMGTDPTDDDWPF